MMPQQGDSPQKLLFHREQYHTEVKQALFTLGRQPENILVFYGRPGLGKKELCDSLFKSLKPDHLCALLDGVEIGQASGDSIKKAVIRLRQDLGRAKAGFTCFDLACFEYLRRVELNSPKNSVGFSRRMGWAETGDNATELINSILEELKEQPIPYIEPLAKR